MHVLKAHVSKSLIIIIIIIDWLVERCMIIDDMRVVGENGWA